MNEDVPEHIQPVFNALPDTLKQEEVEAIIMAIAQIYAPTKHEAVGVLLQCAVILKNIYDTIEEAKTATKQ